MVVESGGGRELLVRQPLLLLTAVAAVTELLREVFLATLLSFTKAAIEWWWSCGGVRGFKSV